MNYIDLSNLTLIQGFKILGGYPNDHTGASVGSAGDINNDGLNDLFIGADWASPAGMDKAGAVYVIYGSYSAPADIDLAKLSLARGFMISGRAETDHTGFSVSNAGDVNGDGITDLIIGAAAADPLGRVDAGVAYVVYGSGRTSIDDNYVVYGSPDSANIDLANLSIERGFAIYGVSAGDYTGISVSSAGDVNNDGIRDVIIGAYFADPVERNNAGAAYVIFGSKSIFANIDLANLTPAQGFTIFGGAPDDHVGRAVNSAGDINNDGINDLIISAYNTSHAGRIGSGSVYIIYGSNATLSNIDLANLTLAQGIQIFGGAGDHVGRSASSAGDINGDGIKDIIIGAVEASPTGKHHGGAAYVIYGSTAISTNIDLTAMTLAQGFIISGGATHEYAGYSVGSAGDINNDGIDDLIVGALYASVAGKYRAGASYVIYGTKFASANIDLANLPTSLGFAISGSVIDDIAGTINSAGDVNNDGINDLIIGAYWEGRNSGGESGAAYVIFGSSTPTFTSTALSISDSTESYILSLAIAQSQKESPTSAPTTQPTVVTQASTSATAVIVGALSMCLVGGIATMSFLYNNNMCCFKFCTPNVDSVTGTLGDEILVGVVTDKYE